MVVVVVVCVCMCVYVCVCVCVCVRVCVCVCEHTEMYTMQIINSIARNIHFLTCFAEPLQMWFVASFFFVEYIFIFIIINFFTSASTETIKSNFEKQRPYLLLFRKPKFLVTLFSAKFLKHDFLFSIDISHYSSRKNE